MKRTCLSIFMAGLMTLGCLGAATAGTEKGDYFVSPMIGGHLFEGNQNLDHSVTYGLGLGHQFTDNFGLEAMFNYTPTEIDVIDKDVQVFPFRLDGYYNILNNKKVEPYIAAGIGVISFKQENVDSEHKFLADYGFGVKYFLSECVALRGDVRHLISFDDRYNNLLYTVGLTCTFGGRKEPVKAVEKAPEPAPAPVPVIAKKEPEPVKAAAPPVVVEKDSDGDGIVDSKDKCPDTPKGVKVDADGCPVDSDGDGIPDYLDQCPDTPKGLKVDDKGCPVDTDGDGVPDHMDKCSGTPKGAKVDERGCWVIEGLQFESGKSIIKKDSYKILGEVLVVLKANPTMKMEIQGFTDNKGKPEKNKQLSEKRAKAVMGFFLSKGVKKDRMTAKGYGQDNPAASNDTPEGCAKNRRVELKPEI